MENCGWKVRTWWEQPGSVKAASFGLCDECRARIDKGDQIMVYLHSKEIPPHHEGMVSADERSFQTGVVRYDGKEIAVGKHVICTDCQSVRKKIIADGYQPVLGRLYKCLHEIEGGE